jgi:hypothetical protein
VVVSRYQTLIAVGGAFVIAWFAAKPVWKQITLISVQTAVALHGAMSARANLLSARADAARARLKKFADSLSLGYHEREGTAALTHWVWDMESITRDEVSFLQFQQNGEFGRRRGNGSAHQSHTLS